MAGKGSRFIKAGYELPKYMIKVKGRTLLEYSLLSIPLEIISKIIFIGLREHDTEYALRSFINSLVEKICKEKQLALSIHIILLDEITRGQAETVYLAKEHIPDDEDLIIYNIDTYFQSKSLKEILLDKRKKADGVIGAFNLTGKDDKWSFASTDEKGKVLKTTEKVQISQNALTGFYHFAKAKEFFDVAEYCINNLILTKNEFYIAPMYNNLIKQGKNYKLNIADVFHPLGTPEDVERFKNE
jgi:NDP-sugar pyrophosphorylase family protein